MIWLWIGFFALIALFLALDLGVFNRENREISVREALAWTMVWVAVSLVFNLFVWALYDYHWFGMGLDASGAVIKDGGTAALEFFTSYLIEKSLSFDNIFVISMIFTYFKVPTRFHHRVLFWGILGAVFLRAAMIGLGLFLVSHFSWIFYVFGVLLIYGAVTMVLIDEETADPEKGLILRLARRFLPIADDVDECRFTTRVDGKFAFTSLALVLLVVETTDVVFALDSIPAIFAITQDPFIILTSNIFAILGLRALYFVLAGMIGKFHYLNLALAAVLVLVGLKMILHEVVSIGTTTSLLVIVGLLGAGVAASVLTQKDPDDKRPSDP